MEENQPRILQKKTTYTIDYPAAIEFANKQMDVFWHPEEIMVEKDIQDLKVNFTEAERHGTITTLKLFTAYEVRLGEEYWLNKVFYRFRRPDIQRMASCFSFYELNIHSPFYSRLNEALGLATDEFYESYTKDPILKERMDFIEKLVVEPSLPVSIAAFSMVEGAVLYSAFAFLKHFQANGKNKLVNVTAGINYSARDECVAPETEVLTPYGWERIDALDGSTPIAQFNPETKEISFTLPSKVYKTHTNSKIEFSHRALSQCVTPNHRLYIRNDWENFYKVKTADKAKFHPKNHIPVAGYGVGDNELTTLEKFYIATQADGSVSDRYTGELCGTRPISFSFSKERKIERFRRLVQELGFKLDILGPKPEKGKVKKREQFRVHIPIGFYPETGLKNFKWADLSNFSAKKAEQFIDEVSKWDGHIPRKESVGSGNYIYYSSVVKENVEVVQAIAALCGKHATMTKQVDKRSPNYSDVYRLYIHDRQELRGGRIKKTIVESSGDMWCVSVPTQAFLIRHENKVSVTGNSIHALGGAWLYKTLVDELKVSEKELKVIKSKIIALARTIEEHENRIIDMVFEKGSMEGITKEDLKTFVRSRINICLSNLGIEGIYEIAKNPIADWFYKNITGTLFHDFFQKVGNSYKRTWSEKAFIWGQVSE